MLLRRAIQQSLSGGVNIADVFSIDLWTGDGASQNIVNGLDLSSDDTLIWIKGRAGGSATENHTLMDSTRTIPSTSYLASNLTSSLIGASSQLLSFNSNGYSLGGNGNVNSFNGTTYVGWSFRKAPKFFDVIKYTGNGVAGREVAHSLGIQAGLVIVKNLDFNRSWYCQHRSIGGTASLFLDSSNEKVSQTIMWNDTDATDTTVTLGIDPAVNANGENYIMYVFAHDPSPSGVIQCGGYSGTSAAGNTIELGWRPQYVLIKSATGTTGGWQLFDNMRDLDNPTATDFLYANSAGSEISTGAYVSSTAAGFSLDTSGAEVNGSGKTYIYMAIRGV